VGLSGEAYRRAHAQAAWALVVLSKIVPVEIIDGLDWRWLADQAGRLPANFLAAASQFSCDPKSSLPALLRDCEQRKIFPRVVVWTLLDHRRVTPVPPGHWLLIEDGAPFRATLQAQGGQGEMRAEHVQSIPVRDVHVACFSPCQMAMDAELILERCATTSPRVSAAIRFLSPSPSTSSSFSSSDLVLLTNGIGGMARMCVDLGRVNSKYDCVLGANLNASVPVDRWIFVKRIRVWVNADGFLSPLNEKNLASFDTGPPATWQFVANAGDGRTVEIELRAEMVEGKNTTVFSFRRPAAERAIGKQLPADADVRLTVRFDIEDRNFHWETKRNGGADYHFSTNTHELPEVERVTPCAPQLNENERRARSDAPYPKIGFAFTPAPDRQLRVFADAGEYHPQPEWCENIPHPVEQSRGQVGSGDAYSPGWFELPLPKGASVTLVATADDFEFRSSGHQSAHYPFNESQSRLPSAATIQKGDAFAEQLTRAAKQFVVRRDQGKTVIAGYPWFLNWGRDSLICARGLLAAGLTDDVRLALLTLARFEENGTLPNAIHGNDASNRDTSDAPLWFALACEEFAALECCDMSRLSKSGDTSPHSKFYDAIVAPSDRTIRDVLTSIAENYARGTPNGIRMDADSALIWSPGHFTWMDTNHPAGTPREGYPVEIQALWIRLLHQLEKISGGDDREKWRVLAERATDSLETLFWLEDKGWLADVLLAKPGVAARAAIPDDALRSNGLFAVSLGLVTGERAKRCVESALKFLVVPGALRSLAPLPVSVPLPIYHNGQLLNNPIEPYCPRYEGDEDTCRKPAYHNGTAWTWTFPVFCEALARAWDFSPEAVAAAKAYLGGMERLLNEGCLGQIPEILDGDAPHAQRGCDAQAWGVTEALRVWKLLNERER
jgi:predicted glycogen debranching enzyme